MEVESLIDGIDFSETLTRDKFEELNMDLFRGTLKPVQKVLEDAVFGKVWLLCGKISSTLMSIGLMSIGISILILK
uniref:Uncharacterized protein n=1 Tax=Meloidogyne floridensis TaxID=298350 RepID=A0A915P2L2_9BILA